MDAAGPQGLRKDDSQLKWKNIVSLKKEKKLACTLEFNNLAADIWKCVFHLLQYTVTAWNEFW